MTGDNGLLSKAGDAKEKNKESEICEQIKLAYVDYEMAKLKNNNLDGKEYLKSSLETVYGENSVKEVKEKNGKYTIKMNDESIYKHNTKTGETYKYVDITDYKGKASTTLVVGDDIEIGTEKFKVFSKTDTEIKAMPYYNLKLDSNPMRQVTSEETPGTSYFSSSIYWTQSTDEINMFDSRNYIQTYITAYETTLHNMGMRDIEVRIAKYSELSVDEITARMRNPSRSIGYWIGSSCNDSTNLRTVLWNGGLSSATERTAGYSIRPIIIIPIE